MCHLFNNVSNNEKKIHRTYCKKSYKYDNGNFIELRAGNNSE